MFLSSGSNDLMRMILYVSMEVQTFNNAVRDGSMGPKITKILDAIKPEAVYLVDRGGERPSF